MEGHIFGEAYVRREICVSKSIGLTYIGKEIYQFCFVLLCIRGQIPYSEGLIHGRAYFRNFTVTCVQYRGRDS